MNAGEIEVIRRIMTLGLAAHTRHIRIKRGADTEALKRSNQQMAEQAEMLDGSLKRYPTAYRAIVALLFENTEIDQLVKEITREEEGEALRKEV